MQVYDFQDLGDVDQLLSMEYVEDPDLRRLQRPIRAKGSRLPAYVEAHIIAASQKVYTAPTSARTGAARRSKSYTGRFCQSQILLRYSPTRNMTVLSAGTLRERARTHTGMLYEQTVTLAGTDGEPLPARRIVLRLDRPTRDGDSELSILTNLPPLEADALAVANLYRKRWTVKTMFQPLTVMFDAEVSALGYPRPALFGFRLLHRKRSAHEGSRSSAGYRPHLLDRVPDRHVSTARLISAAKKKTP